MNRYLIDLSLVFLFSAIIAGAAGNACETVLDENPKGDDPIPEQGIIGGEQTNYEEWKGVVGLFSGMSICSAVMLAPDIALSAGHCVLLTSIGQPTVNYVRNPTTLQLLGGSNLDIFYSYGEKVIKHPTWQGNLWPNAVDLSMIKLEEPLEDVEIYKVRKAPQPKIGDKGIIVGYGMASTDEMSAGTHRVGDTTILRMMGGRIELGNPAGTCQGDSGGPFFTDQNGEWVVTGITSFGTTGTCLATGGGWDINVVTYRSWIEKTFLELAGYELPEVEASPLDGDDTGGDSGSDSDGDGDGDDDGDSDGDDGDSDGDSDEDCGCRTTGALSVFSFVALIFSIL